MLAVDGLLEPQSHAMVRGAAGRFNQRSADLLAAGAVGMTR